MAWEPESITREEKNRCSLQERKIDREFVNNNGFPFWRLSFLLVFCNTIEYGWKCCTMPFFWFHHEKSWTSTACHSARSAIDNNSLCGGYFPDSIGNMTNLKKNWRTSKNFCNLIIVRILWYRSNLVGLKAEYIISMDSSSFDLLYENYNSRWQINL